METTPKRAVSAVYRCCRLIKHIGLVLCLQTIGALVLEIGTSKKDTSGTAGKLSPKMKECAPISEHHGTGRGTTSIPYSIQVKDQDDYTGGWKEGEWKQEVGRCTFER